MAVACVMIAEDDELIREVTSRILKNAGYEVLPASDGEEAISLFEARQEEIHMVLLDVVMPRLGGPAVYKHIRKSHPGLPVLFTTGYSPTELEPLLAEDPCVNLLYKPYRANDLVAELQRLAAAAAG
jgi:two-component system cell cycle sensor histidine kinase/response regulator CckA